MATPIDIEIVRADETHVETLTPLFDAYRRYYDLASDAERARRFLSDRLSADESVIFLAREASDSSIGLGFTQLYPGFSSLRMARSWRLNDLFVAPEARGRGVGRGLMNAAIAFARGSGAGAIELCTERDNAKARPLYESLGFRCDERFVEYAYEIEGD